MVRIETIRKIANHLASLEWSEIDLILSSHEVIVDLRWNNLDKFDYLIESLKEASEDTLSELTNYVAVSSNPDYNTPTKNNELLQVFLSHSSAHRKFVSQVALSLSLLGVVTFVAHTDIEPTSLWQKEIESALNEFDVFIPFLHHEFRQSLWCDQELGWALSRGLFIVPLKFDMHPYGFSNQIQAIECTGLSPDAVSEKIAEILLPRVAKSLIAAISTNSDFRSLRIQLDYLSRIPIFTEDELQKIERLNQINPTLANLWYKQTYGNQWIVDFIKQRKII